MKSKTTVGVASPTAVGSHTMAMGSGMQRRQSPVSATIRPDSTACRMAS